MPGSRWSVPVTALSPLAVASLAWRYTDTLYLTVLAKATLRLVPGGTSVITEAVPIITADGERDGFPSPREDAPTLRRADVTAWGILPAGMRDAALVVGLGGQRLVARYQRVQGPAVRCFGPVVGEARARRLAEEPIAFDARFDWRALQLAPIEQQLDSLRGDEWIAMRGLHPQHHEISTRLPAHYVVAKLYDAPDALPAFPVPLRLDTISIAAHRLSATLVWRGYWPLPGAEVPTRMRVLVGAAPFGQVPDFPEAAPDDEDDDEDWSAMRATRAVTDDDLARMAAALPSFIDADHSPEDDTSVLDAMRGTRTLDDDQFEAIKSSLAAAPFALATEKQPAAAIPGAPWADDAGPKVVVPEGLTSTIATDSPLDAVAAAIAETEGRGTLEPARAEQARLESERRERERLARSEQERREQERLAAERAEQARLEEERQAEARREAEAKRFAEEQERARLEEQRRREEDASRRREAATKLRTNMYSGFGRKR